MRLERRLLILGSSLVAFSENGEADALPALVEAELSRLDPESRWRCQSKVLYLSADALPRMEAALQEIRPDAVAFELSTYQFVHEAVLLRLRKWPLLYRVAGVITGFFSAAGGGGFTGAPGARGALFRLPRDLARRLIGVEVEQSVEASVARACAALDALRARGLPFVYSTPPFYWPEPDPGRGSALVATATNAMSAYCALHGIVEYDLPGELAAMGAPLGLSADNLHYDLPTRRVQVRAIAASVIETVSRTRESAAARPATVA
jgi:hypothetical protein